MTDEQLQDYPRGIFLGTAIAAEEAEIERRDELMQENTGLKERIAAMSQVMAEYALTISELRVKLVEAEKRLSNGNCNG